MRDTQIFILFLFYVWQPSLDNPTIFFERNKNYNAPRCWPKLIPSPLIGRFGLFTKLIVQTADQYSRLRSHDRSR